MISHLSFFKQVVASFSCSANNLDIAQWFDKFLEHAMLINMHDFLPAELYMMRVMPNITFPIVPHWFHFKWKMLRKMYNSYTSPTSIVNPSILFYFPEDPNTVDVSKGQLEVIECITKCTGQFLKGLISVPSNASNYRFITIDYKINFDQCVQMLESIYRYILSLIKKVRMFPTFVVSFIRQDLIHWKRNSFFGIGAIYPTST